MSAYSNITFPKEEGIFTKSTNELGNSTSVSCDIFSDRKHEHILTDSQRHSVACGVTVLDGGMGRELRVSYPEPDYDLIWSAAHLLNQPESVYECHLSFIKAGADIITTSNYACVPTFLEKLNVTDRTQQLVKVAGEMALKAKQHSNEFLSKQVKVAGSLPPLCYSFIGWSIPDKSKHMSSYAEIAQTLFPFIDIFLCETMSSVDEAVTALGGLETAKMNGLWGDSHLPVWLSFSLKDSVSPELHSGEKLGEALQAVLAKFPGLINGLFLNCCAPKAITAALPSLIKIGREAGISTFGAYANRFSSCPDAPQAGRVIDGRDSPKRRPRILTDIPVGEYLEHVNCWINLGCTVVGGCCGIGPEYIQDISKLKNKLK